MHPLDAQEHRVGEEREEDECGENNDHHQKTKGHHGLFVGDFVHNHVGAHDVVQSLRLAAVQVHHQALIGCASNKGAKEVHFWEDGVRHVIDAVQDLDEGHRSVDARGRDELYQVLVSKMAESSARTVRGSLLLGVLVESTFQVELSGKDGVLLIGEVVQDHRDVDVCVSVGRNVLEVAVVAIQDVGIWIPVGFVGPHMDASTSLNAVFCSRAVRKGHGVALGLWPDVLSLAVDDFY